MADQRSRRWIERWKVLEVLTAIGALGTAVGAIAIPIVLDASTEKRHATEVDTRTLQMLNDTNREIARILRRQSMLLHAAGDPVLKNFEDITRDRDIHDTVKGMLNEYDYICLGGNKNLLNSRIMQDLRGHAIRATWKKYQNYIVKYRDTIDKDAWIECDKWMKVNDPDWK
jgi:hypothetical protein